MYKEIADHGGASGAFMYFPINTDQYIVKTVKAKEAMDFLNEVLLDLPMALALAPILTLYFSLALTLTRPPPRGRSPEHEHVWRYSRRIGSDGWI